MKKIMIAGLFVLLAAGVVYGQDQNKTEEKSKGIMGGLEKLGIHPAFSYIGELWANTRGGHKRDQTHLHKIDIAVSLDTKYAGLWDKGTFMVHLLSTPGGRLLSGEIVGDSQGVSNIEAPHSTRLYELWYEHLLFDEKLSVLFGIHDLNSEFAVSEHAALFVNSSFGISKNISGGGRPSIYPMAAPAARIRYMPSSDWEFQLGAYNGDPGNPAEYRHFPRIAFDGKSGVFVTFEAARHFGSEDSRETIKAGYWKNTGGFENLIDVKGNPTIRKGHEGLYLIADAMLVMNKENGGLGAFLQFSYAPDRHVDEFQTYIGGGLNYTGLIPCRPMDELGIAVAQARVGDKTASSGKRDRAETALEITYRMVFNKYFALQPDVQWVFNPSADSTLRNATVAGLRFQISY